MALHCGDMDVLDDGDLFAFLDGGKFANDSMLVNSLVHPDTGKSFPKRNNTIYISRTEDAANNNKDNVRGVATVQQLESLHLVSKTALRTQKKNRVTTDGTTAGTLIGPLALPDPDTVWKCSVKDK